MNSTRWLSLTEFVKHLGRQGIVRVDETDKGFFIAWIDNSPKALAKAVRITLLACSIFNTPTEPSSPRISLVYRKQI
jgi:Domain of Kin17 curved DNA-binding protein